LLLLLMLFMLLMLLMLCGPVVTPPASDLPPFLRDPITPPHVFQQTYRLPPVKEFGRRRDHLSCAGWGHWGPGGVWQGIGEGGGPPGAPTAHVVPFADEYIDRVSNRRYYT
jgi:hypothetical protein